MSEEEARTAAVAQEEEFDPTLLKKKKKKSKKTEVDGVDEVTELMNELGTKKSDDAEGDENAGGEGDFELKKKKKKKSKSAATSAFDQELQAAGVDAEARADAEGGDDEAAGPGAGAAGGANEDGNTDLTYPQLLSRFFDVLRENNPDLAGDRAVKYKIPPPIVGREGNKKSMFANVKEISDRMHRPTEHVIQFLFAELGTSGSVDGSNRLIIKGRFQQKQIETVLRRYIVEYVTCKTCKSVNTTLKKENRLYFLDCNSCGSRRSVSSIKTGYQAIMRRRDLKKKIG